MISDDYTFGFLWGDVGPQKHPYGHAGGCSGVLRGFFDIDLRGTKFQLKEGVRIYNLFIRKSFL